MVRALQAFRRMNRAKAVAAGGNGALVMARVVPREGRDPRGRSAGPGGPGVAVVCLLTALSVAVSRAETGTTTIVTGATNAGSLYVLGSSGGLNSLEVRGPGGWLTASNSVIGLAAAAGTNSATVTGSGARWSTLDTFYLGLTGAVNRLTITNAGVATNGAVFIGYEEGSRRNSALVTGANSRWHADNLLVVGQAGPDNTLIVSNGAIVQCGFDGLIGAGEATATNNAVVVTGAGSRWHSDNALYVGYVGAGSRLHVSSAGVVGSGSGVVGSFASSNNAVTITGAGSSWQMPAGDLVIGDAESAGNQLLLTNGGWVTSLNASLGNVDVPGGNAATVSGSGSRWLVGSSLAVGEAGSLNQLQIQSGGVVTNLEAVVGMEPSSSSNRVTVTGAGSSWTNRTLIVGEEGSANSVTVQAGGVLNSRTNYIGLAASARGNTLTVTGAGSRSITAQSGYVGYAGCDNAMTVSGGAQASQASTWVGVTVDSCSNRLWLADPGTTLSNATALEVGFDGTGHRLVITNGARALSAFGRVSTYGYLTTALVTGTNSAWINSGELYVGQVGAGTRLTIEKGGAISNLNGYAGVYNFDTSVTVTGPGSRWINSGDLYVNYGGIQHQLVISNGAVVTNLNGYVGISDASVGSTVQVTGPGSAWVNSRSLYLGFAGLDNRLLIANGGTVRATNLVAGLLESSSNTVLGVAAGSLLVTNPGNTARIDVQRGTLALSNGLVRTSHLLLGASALLTGTGTNIAAWTTNSGTLAPGHGAGRLYLHGSLALRPGSVLRCELGGFDPGVTHDFLSVSNAAVLGGTLAVSFINGFQNALTNGASFTVMRAASLVGAFANASNGARLISTDGLADFVVNYTGGNVVLSQVRVFPRLLVSPAALDFGTVAAGTSVTQAFQVVNAGGLGLTGSVSALPPFAVASGGLLNLGPGQTGQVRVSFSPAGAGSFSNLAVFVSNGGSSTHALSGRADLLPLAQFSATPTNGLAPLAVTFTDTSTGSITNRWWQFGDGATTNTSATQFVHLYALPGTNWVTLTVTGPLGSNTLTLANHIAVAGHEFLIMGARLRESDVIVWTATLFGRSYQLERRDNVAAGAWMPVGDVVAGTGGVVELTDAGGAGKESRFYRVRESP
jgi:T5SS/PEP-CTERM-associated repeat protein